MTVFWEKTCFDRYTFTEQVRSQVRRHGFDALGGRGCTELHRTGREGYGLLLGSKAFGYVVGCLPVGETIAYRDGPSRFRLIPQAWPMAVQYASEWALEIAGLYHTDYGCCQAKRVGNEKMGRTIRVEEQMPPEYRHLFLLVRPPDGGETIWGDHLVTWDAGNRPHRWSVRKSLALPMRQLWNQRRILNRWHSRWRR